MEKLKVYIRHVMLLKFKNNKNSIEAIKKFSSIYGQDVITDRQVKN